jgi:organic hydroperoxide reductase OsmC/OhrA
MSEYYADIAWKRSPDDIFSDNKYSRAHTWSFDGGVTVPASSSPHVVPIPYSIETNVDPEEAFVASLSSCHMLWFLYLAADKKYVVESYRDQAIGIMAKNADGKLAMTEVTLRPKVVFGGELKPTDEQINKLHHVAHDKCFIANSVKTDVKVEPL